MYQDSEERRSRSRTRFYGDLNEPQSRPAQRVGPQYGQVQRGRSQSRDNENFARFNSGPPRQYRDEGREYDEDRYYDARGSGDDFTRDYMTRGRSRNVSDSSGVQYARPDDSAHYMDENRSQGYGRPHREITRPSRSSSLNSLGLNTHHASPSFEEDDDELPSRIQGLSIVQAPAEPSAERGGAATRGAVRQQKRQAARRLASGATVTALPRVEETVAAENAAQDVRSPAKPIVYLPEKYKDLKPELKPAWKALQDEVSSTFRAVIGVPSGQRYPNMTVERRNEITDELFLNPVFEGMVTHATNNALFAAVARQVDAKLSEGEKFYPPGLALKGFELRWPYSLLSEMARTSFRSCKTQWRAQEDEAVARKQEDNRRANRERERRITKANQLEMAIELFATKYNVKPESVKELIHYELMSDEASGPDQADTRGFAAWKTRMAFKAGLGELPDAAYDDKHFLEVLEMPWRSGELTDALHKLAVLSVSLMTDNQRKKIRYTRVRGTGRTSSRIPDIAPYNFGIDKTWFETHKEDPNCQHLLVDWGKWPGPEGFGTPEDAGFDGDAESNGEE
ncbi:hypothetical protein C8F04DRAFT_1387707 [Mycena alexandri]|uniref:Uncharacterized protein n=1 Tax=Mycena alexandri TaxID=1745969 RepID=A0AAD6XI65_9AGAR|nr:hypothetical protein C8F04DRAFT_1387707 [Mycena alexandri]